MNVTVDAPLLKVTLLNSGALKGRAAKLIVWAEAELKVMGAAKLQEEDVETFVHEPETVHELAAVEVTYAAALLMLTFPAAVTDDAFVRRTPAAPLTVSPPPIVSP